MRSFVLILFALGSACGGQVATASDASTDTGTPTDGGGTDSSGSCKPETRTGQTILVSCATKVSLHDAGDGFAPAPPAGSNCHGESTFTLDLATAKLDWSSCSIPNDPSTPWQLVTGSRTLSSSELSSATASLRKITVAAPGMCGADKPTETVTVTTPSAVQEYTDVFYSCQGGGKIYVDNIDQAFATLSPLAHP